MPARILVIDNYDSFVYNLAQYLGQLGAEPVVRRNDAVSTAELDELGVAGVLLSPGPGTPEEAGCSVDMVRECGRRGLPLLGVCLGHQAIGAAFGGRVVRAPVTMHGKTSEIWHRGVGIFRGLPNPFVATRYHSLIVERESLPPSLEITAETEDGIIMAFEHRKEPIAAVQFHPESIMTLGHNAGMRIIENIVAHLPRKAKEKAA